MIYHKDIINGDDVSYLRYLYKSMPMVHHSQYHNLFNISISNISPSFHSPPWNTIQNKLREYYISLNFEQQLLPAVITNYFLTYEVGSYAIMHQDNPNSIQLSAITLIGRSDILEGGDLIVMTKDSLGKEKVPEVVIFPRDGHTVSYTTNDHGVSRVFTGKRVVLVSWFRRLNNENN